MSGPPGSGKTLLARSLPAILPRTPALALARSAGASVTPSEALDIARIYAGAAQRARRSRSIL